MLLMYSAAGPPPEGADGLAASAGGPPAGTGEAVTQPPYVDDLDRQGAHWSRDRRRVVRALILLYLVVPFLSRSVFFGPHSLGTAKVAFLAAATAAFMVLADRFILPPPSLARRAPWDWLAILVGLAVAILAVGGSNWVDALVIASAAVGRSVRTVRAVAVGVGCCVAAGVGAYLVQGTQNYSNTLTILIGMPLAAFFAYSAARRIELVSKLRETRAELARMAVADERLRIARDLHDLLGHSLSLITLKAELAGRVIEADPERAAREIADLESVARRSLGEVRAAVTSYRQPSLAAELAAARQMLTAAGMEFQVHAAASAGLPPATDALLAWAVREGATNVVRHSGARNVTITIADAGDEVTAEVADDGVGPSWDAARGPGDQDGSGLSGLTERARKAGAEVSAGQGPGGKGFRLLVRVPARRAAGS
jgi:two-component system, NarL family, sensor histidine kinase DesK